MAAGGGARARDAVVQLLSPLRRSTSADVHALVSLASSARVPFVRVRKLAVKLQLHINKTVLASETVVCASRARVAVAVHVSRGGMQS
eukprot:5898498-Prymnesium_polylepis.1